MEREEVTQQLHKYWARIATQVHPAPRPYTLHDTPPAPSHPSQIAEGRWMESSQRRQLLVERWPQSTQCPAQCRSAHAQPADEPEAVGGGPSAVSFPWSLAEMPSETEPILSCIKACMFLVPSCVEELRKGTNYFLGQAHPTSRSPHLPVLWGSSKPPTCPPDCLFRERKAGWWYRAPGIGPLSCCFLKAQLAGTVAYLEVVNSALVHFIASIFILSVMAFRQ